MPFNNSICFFFVLCVLQTYFSFFICVLAIRRRPTMERQLNTMVWHCASTANSNENQCLLFVLSEEVECVYISYLRMIVPVPPGSTPHCHYSANHSHCHVDKGLLKYDYRHLPFNSHQLMRVIRREWRYSMIGGHQRYSTGTMLTNCHQRYTRIDRQKC